MRLLTKFIGLGFGLTLVSCGSGGKNPGDSLATTKAVDSCSTTTKPKLYTINQPLPNTTTILPQFIAGFMDQNCQEQRVYLEACGEEGAKALLGLLATTPTTISNEAWTAFIQDDGEYHRHPHLSCTSGATVTPSWAEGHKPEVHIVSGNGGFSSLDVVSRNESGVSSRLHYVAPHACIGLRRQLRAESFADPSDPSVTTALTLRPGDDAIYLNCSKERPIQVMKEGWSLFKSKDLGSLVYMARYRSSLTAPSQDLVILSTNGQFFDDSEENRSELKKVEETILSRFTLDTKTVIPFDHVDEQRNQILYDLCTATDCSQFVPQHLRLLDRDVVEMDAQDRSLVLHILPSNAGLHTIQPDLKDPGKLTAFTQCSKETDLAGFLGLKHPVEPTDWWTRVSLAANNYLSFDYEEFPCLARRSVCRISVGGEDLSAKASSLYNGISSLMRRPTAGVCSIATDLELTVTSEARVTGQPWKIGNLSDSIQKPFNSIRIIGGAQGLITLDKSCTDCQSTPAPALQIVGPGEFSVENLAFRSLDLPTSGPSIALQAQGTSLGRPRLSMKGVRVQGATATGDQPFAVGFSFVDSDVAVWNANVESYYMGLDAQGSKVSIFGLVGTDKKPLGTSSFKVVGPTTAALFPGTDLRPLNSLRALRLSDSLLSLFGTVLDGPFGLDLSGYKTGSIAETRGSFNRFSNSGNSLGTRSSALYLKGYALANLSWTDIRDLGGLIEFDSQNFTASTEGNFNVLQTGSVLKRNKKIIQNAERGKSNFAADCKSWDEINLVCVL